MTFWEGKTHHPTPKPKILITKHLYDNLKSNTKKIKESKTLSLKPTEISYLFLGRQTN